MSEESVVLMIWLLDFIYMQTSSWSPYQQTVWLWRLQMLGNLPPPDSREWWRIRDARHTWHWKHANNKRTHKPVDLKRCGNQSCVVPPRHEFNSTSIIEVQSLSHPLPKPHLSSPETPCWIIRGNSHGWDFCNISSWISGHCHHTCDTLIFYIFLWTVFLCLNYNYYTIASA